MARELHERVAVAMAAAVNRWPGTDDVAWWPGTEVVAREALDAIPNGWAKIEGRWVRLVQFDSSCEADGVGGHWHVDPEMVED